MTTVEKFLKEEWEIDEQVEEVDSWKHIHEFAHRYENLESDRKDDHSLCISILQSMGYQKEEIDELIRWFEDNGGYCDYEVGWNVLSRCLTLFCISLHW